MTTELHFCLNQRKYLITMMPGRRHFCDDCRLQYYYFAIGKSVCIESKVHTNVISALISFHRFSQTQATSSTVVPLYIAIHPNIKTSKEPYLNWCNNIVTITQHGPTDVERLHPMTTVCIARCIVKEVSSGFAPPLFEQPP